MNKDIIREALEYGRQARPRSPLFQKALAELDTPSLVAGEPVAWTDVLRAIRAVDNEAERRGRMFPQERNNQAIDRKAAQRVCEMIEWYATKGGSVAMKLPDWPLYAHPQVREAVTVDKIMEVVWRWAIDAKMVNATTEPHALTNDLRTRLTEMLLHSKTSGK